MTDDTGPFRQAHHLYWNAGWPGVLPVGRAPTQKTPVPVDYTGHAGRWPSYADLATWAAGPEGDRNIGLRLPADMIGLDVDAYGEKVGAQTLAGLIDKFGPLPPTWVTSARNDGVSGIRLYRVPPGLNWPGEAGPHIEIIQTGHRYAIVWPSVNPDAGGARYEWLIEDGFGARLAAVEALGAEHELPRPGDVPALPEAWVTGLALSYDRVAPATMEDQAAWTWLSSCRAGDAYEACEVIRRVMAGALAELRGKARSRHEVARDASRAVTAYGGEGHRGAWSALHALGEAFLASVSEDRGRDGPAEWWRISLGAVKLAAARHPTPRGSCDCALLAGEGVRFEYDPPVVPPVTDVAGGEIPAPTTWKEYLRSRLMTAAQIRVLPSPEPLINGLLDMNSLAWLIGEPGSYKSFVALDFAGHVGAGQAWQGRRVRQGAVVYLVAEGAAGMTLRLRAWESAYGEMREVFFLPLPVQVADAQAWQGLVELVSELAPALVVLDTQARMTVGVEENSATEMGRFIEAAGRLRVASGGCVLVVHHTARGGSAARGSSAIDGAQDSELRMVKRDGLAGELFLDKQKDAADGTAIPIRLRRVEQGVDAVTGRDLSSLVVLSGDDMARVGYAVPGSALAAMEQRLKVETGLANQTKVLAVVEALWPQGGTGCTRAEVKGVILRAGLMSDRTFHRQWSECETAGLLAQVDGKERFVVSDAGLKIVKATINFDPEQGSK